MIYDQETIIKLICATLLPVVLSGSLYILEKKTKLGVGGNKIKNILIGIVFGIAAILGTEFGIQIEGAILNVRNAAPLTAGLIFGGPAGIIAGLIGGAYRYMITLGGVGDFSQLACSLGCIFAGLIGAACRKFMFDNKKTSWFYGLAIGITTEVLHMLLVFITNMNDIETAFTVVGVCAGPMILCNGISVMLSLLVVSRVGRKKQPRTKRKKQISQVFQFLLLICVIVAFAVTCIFTNTLQQRIAENNVDSLLSLNLEDVKADIVQASDDNLLAITRKVSEKVTLDTSRDELVALCQEYGVVGINLIDQRGIIKESTKENFVGYDMAGGEQSGEFLCLIDDQEEFVQGYMPLSHDSSISRKYAGVALDGGGFVQVGYDAEQFQKQIEEAILMSVDNRHIGKTGGVIVCDEDHIIITGNNAGHVGTEVVLEEEKAARKIKPGESFVATVGDVDSYCMYDKTEGFLLVATLPVKEATFPRDIAIYMLMFMEIIVFAALFADIYFLIKRLIVDNIHRINNSLSEITRGNLDITVNVRDNEEFSSLSDDINSTVDTLKAFIKEAETRIDRELEFARQIQRSSLPSVFPPYPDRKDFSIYGYMDAAKEVGGDFYDFYLTDPTHLTFMVADVSGKGIPGAMFMMRSKTLIKNLVESGRSIDQVFDEANKALCENNEAEMFVTAWMGRLDLETGLLEYVNAGHNPPLVKRNGGYEYLRSKPNFILAGLEMTKYTKHEVQLSKGDEIFLYTDGVTEATNYHGQMYGEERLDRILAFEFSSPKKVCDGVLADIRAFTKGAEQSDDITMLCVKLEEETNGEAYPQKELLLKPEIESMEMAAAFVEESLSSWQCPESTLNKVQVSIDEIFSNVIKYSQANQAKITLKLLDKALEMMVEDDGTPYDPTREKEPDVTLSVEERQIGGLGIFMVKKLASQMEYTYQNGKNTLVVTFKIEEKE